MTSTGDTTMSVALVSDDSEAGESGGSQANTADSASTHLLILHLDVGQGESALLVEMVGQTPIAAVVIDGGHATPGRGSLIRYINALGITRIDFMICSHFDSDHTRGLTDFIVHHGQADGGDDPTRIKVGGLYTRAGNSGGSTSTGLLTAARDAGIAVTEVGAEIDVATAHGRATFHGYPSERGELFDENRGSLAWLITFGQLTYFTGGDLPLDLELTVAQSIGRPIDCLKCGHHGSKNSTSPEVLDILNPVAAVISCGRHSYGHPSYTVIEALMAEGRALSGLFATNCFHNRRCFGHPYQDTERYILRDMIAFEFYRNVAAAREEATTQGAASEADIVRYADLVQVDMGRRTATVNEAGIATEIAALTTYLTSVTEEQVRSDISRTIRVFKAILRSCRHRDAAGLRDVASPNNLGRLAGNHNVLGTVCTFFPWFDPDGVDPYFYVGQHDDAPAAATPDDISSDDRLTFKWFWMMRGQPMASELRQTHRTYFQLDHFADVLEGAILDLGGSIGTVVAAAGSPMRFAESYVDRSHTYAQFSLPTLVGMSDTAQRTPYVPFCAACLLDVESEEAKFDMVEVFFSTPSFEGISHNPLAHFHRGCLMKVIEAMTEEMGVRFQEWSSENRRFEDLTTANLGENQEFKIGDADVTDYLYRESLRDWVSIARDIYLRVAADLAAPGDDPADHIEAAWAQFRTAAASAPQRRQESDDDYVGE